MLLLKISYIKQRTVGSVYMFAISAILLKSYTLPCEPSTVKICYSLWPDLTGNHKI